MQASNSDAPKALQQEHLAEVASHALSFFDATAKTAQEGLRSRADSQADGQSALVAINTMADGRAARSLDQIHDELLRELAQLAIEPAIARLVLRDENEREQIYFITRAGTVPSQVGLMASYRSPIGRLAALRVGHDDDVRTPSGMRNYQLIERAALRPSQKSGAWDSVNTVLHTFGHGPLTIVSLRQLIEETKPEDADYIERLLAEGRAAENILEGIRRDVRKKMGLRNQPLLDEIQDNIFRMPLDSRLVILGPPGTGDLPLKFHPAAIRASAGFAPVDAVSCWA